MIEARQFIDAARERGFEWFAGVPCSYLTPFINFVLQEPGLRYLSMANEGDAVALIAGTALARAPSDPRRRGVTLMQNSGLGNAVSPLTSLTWTFRLPQLLIVTWRGQPGVPDEPQHALMGPITPTILDAMEVPWERFPTDREAVGPALDRAIAHMDATGRPYALLMQKGSVAPFALRADAGTIVRHRTAAAGLLAVSAPAARPSRQQVLQTVIDHTPPASTVVLASTGYCGRELCALADRPNQLYMVGSMGCVGALALGFALARPDLRVVAIDGDGAALMRMGTFATIGAYGAANLQHLLLDNGAHESTGGQATVSPQISLAEVATACGYAASFETDQLAAVGAWLDAPAAAGPRFARVLIRPGVREDLGRPTHTPVEVKLRLMDHVHPNRRAA